MSTKVLLKDERGIPFPLPSDGRKMWTVVSYLKGREEALASGNATETGKIGERVLSSIFFRDLDGRPRLLELTKDYEYYNVRADVQDCPNDILIYRTMYVEHNRATWRYTEIPDHDEKVSGEFAPWELEGYQKSSPLELRTTVPVTTIFKRTNVEGSLTPPELEYFLFMEGYAEDSLVEWVYLPDYHPVLVGLGSLSSGDVRYATWDLPNEKHKLRKLHTHIGELPFVVIELIREKKNYLKYFYPDLSLSYALNQR